MEKMFKIMLGVLGLYALSSGPVGGLICFGMRRWDFFSDHPFFLQKCYLWHMTFYSPLLWLATQVRLEGLLVAYWSLFGWEFVFTA